MSTWHIYKGTGHPHDGIKELPDPPKWRNFDGKIQQEPKRETDPELKRRFGNLSGGQTFIASDKEIDLVNAALFLRRALLVTGKPGTGKSSIAYAVAHELKLGKVLLWPITSRSVLRDALYQYDAIGRLQAAQLQEDSDIGHFIRLGPLGTALLPSSYPRVLLIDEIDKSDIDLPNDLLHVFEEGAFEIPELKRLSKSQEQVSVFPYDSEERVPITQGKVRCHAFPFIVMTSNAERELPPAFLRRCIRLDIQEPNEEKLARIVRVHFGDSEAEAPWNSLIATFLKRRDQGDLATDQLLNAIYLTSQDVNLDKRDLLEVILKHLTVR